MSKTYLSSGIMYSTKEINSHYGEYVKINDRMFEINDVTRLDVCNSLNLKGVVNTYILSSITE